MTESAQISVREEDGAVEIIGGGSLLLWNSDELRDALQQASLHSGSVLVDLRRAIFVDTAIVQYLARSAVTLIKRGKRLRVIVAAGGHPKRALEISGLTSLMDVEVVPADEQQ